jgi:hypothetical protein
MAISSQLLLFVVFVGFLSAMPNNEVKKREAKGRIFILLFIKHFLLSLLPYYNPPPFPLKGDPKNTLKPWKRFLDPGSEKNQKIALSDFRFKTSISSESESKKRFQGSRMRAIDSLHKITHVGHF